MTHKKIKFQRGLSLIELMVAIVLGLLLSLVVIQVFLSSRGVFRMQDSVSRLQETGRFSLGVLSQDIRMAGFMGCPSLARVPVNNTASALSDYSVLPEAVLVGYNNVAAGNAWGAVAGTDVLTLRKASTGTGARVQAVGGGSIQLADEQGVPTIAVGDVLMITNCLNADMFRASAVASAGGVITVTPGAALVGAYGPKDMAEVFPFESIEYFIRDTGRTTVAGNRINGLFVRRLTTVTAGGAIPAPAPVAYELVEGVENMQLEFGLDAAGDDGAVDVYRTANAIAATDWSQVLTVRINLLLQNTEDNVNGTAPEQAQSLTFMGAAVPADGRLRQVFSSTVAVRSRLE